MAEFVYVDERDVEEYMRVLAENNPGCEVRVYALEQVAECPAAEIVVKKVSAHGVLPASVEVPATPQEAAIMADQLRREIDARRAFIEGR
jgi:hypothetical protein